MKKMAILVMTPEAFRGLLQLPEGAELVDVSPSLDRRGVLEVKIEGAGWNTKEGEVIMRTTGTCRTAEGGLFVIDWRMPNA